MIKNMKKSLMMFISALMTSVASAYDAKIDGICYNLVPKANMADVHPTVSIGQRWRHRRALESLVFHSLNTYFLNLGAKVHNYSKTTKLLHLFYNIDLDNQRYNV